MESIQMLFLEALKAALENRQVEWKEGLQPQDGLTLLRMASTHQILPMIYEAVYPCLETGQEVAYYKKSTIQSVTLQTIKTSEFLSLFRHLSAAGVTPCVVKGVVCRSLYPNPDYRLSGDEDVLIPPEQFSRCHAAMLEYGMTAAAPEEDLDHAYEVPYGKKGSPLYIELHKSLFPPDSSAYGEMNRFFEGAEQRMISLNIQGTPVTTLGYTDHFLYLICHAFKHFLHSGFGIRQVCDIVLFANSYGGQIDWDWVLACCREIHAERFAATLFRIGRKYLTFDPEKACYPAAWQELEADETAMLEDLLDSGIYGDSNMSRKHSSNMTLSAVTAQKEGKRGGSHVLKTVFPPAKSLEGRYPYLKKHPYLLPVAWASRILKYRKETRTVSNDDAAESIKIGKQRIELLKEYGIIDS